ncbi:MAG: hypothetical protein ACKPGK_07040 [Verrucomicrobiota bacterium]
MRSLTKHLTPDELRILWILTALVVLGVAGRVWIASHPADEARGANPAAPVPNRTP